MEVMNEFENERMKSQRVFIDMFQLNQVCFDKYISPKLHNNSISEGMYGVALFPTQNKNAQDVTFLSIEEVTLHHKDVARQHPHCALFVFNVYDNVAMSNFSQ